MKRGDATASQLASKAETEKDGEVMRIGVKINDELDSCSLYCSEISTMKKMNKDRRLTNNLQ